MGCLFGEEVEGELVRCQILGQGMLKFLLIIWSRRVFYLFYQSGRLGYVFFFLDYEEKKEVGFDFCIEFQRQRFNLEWGKIEIRENIEVCF